MSSGWRSAPDVFPAARGRADSVCEMADGARACADGETRRTGTSSRKSLPGWEGKRWIRLTGYFALNVAKSQHRGEASADLILGNLTRDMVKAKTRFGPIRLSKAPT